LSKKANRKAHAKKSLRPRFANSDKAHDGKEWIAMEQMSIQTRCAEGGRSAQRQRHAVLKSAASRMLMMLQMTAVLFISAALFADAAHAADLRVMKMGLGSGTVTSSVAGINCGADCDETYAAATTVTLTATPAADSSFAGWEGDCTGMTCTIGMASMRSVRAKFNLTAAIPVIANFTPEGIRDYLLANPHVNTLGRFVAALPEEYKWNWLLMTRSESLQTGTAALPRILMPSADAQLVFSIGLGEHSSYPGAHRNAIEYMQWDGIEKNFRFHEIVLDAILPMNGIPARSRSVAIDDEKCSKCHSTRNVLNKTTYPGTTGIPVGLVKAKNKPNWDTYDSWAGMLAFNRDRIYKGSVEAAAFRKIFNLWTWRNNDTARPVIEQLALQPDVPDIPAADVITRLNSGGANDGHIVFAFDGIATVTTEPSPTGSGATISTAYAFNAMAGAPGTGTSLVRGGEKVTLHHSMNPDSDEGRAVHFFDLVGGGKGVRPNQKRIADEVINHRFATGSVPIDVRPIALAIAKGCVAVDTPSDSVRSTGTTALSINNAFFNSRNGMLINALVADTGARAQSLPRRKADLQKINLDRAIDVYLSGADLANGLIAEYGAATTASTTPSLATLRQEIFRRPEGNNRDPFMRDSATNPIYVDRELHDSYSPLVALYRYFLEPLGVSVDKWSTSVRGRSRTYTFADVFGSYTSTFISEFETSLTASPVVALAPPFNCDGSSGLIAAVNSTLSSLPQANAVPTYTDVQRIFNKSCIECHGGLNYPPYSNYSNFPSFHVDFSENENPAGPNIFERLARSHMNASGLVTTDPATSPLYQRITATSEDCPSGLMPCGGPALSKTDIETIRRWIVGPPTTPSTLGDPHIRTVDGVNYDFQSAGEFTLLRNENLEIQVRQTPVTTETPLGPDSYTGLSSCASLNSAAAVRVGPHRISFQPNINGEPDPRGMQLRIDGKLFDLKGVELILPSGARIVSTGASGGIRIEAPGGLSIVITPHWWAHYQVWYLNVHVENARATEGIMGARAHGSWLPALPDGGSLGPKPADLHKRYLQLYDKFANAWRVTDKTSLFDYAPGYSTRDFTVVTWPEESPKACNAPPQPSGPIKREPLKQLPLDVAEKYCGGVIAKDRRANCVQDVRFTGEPSFANAYLVTEKLERNNRPIAPELLYPKNHETGVGIPTKFAWNKTVDKDGDPITYRHCLWAAGEIATFKDCEPAPDPKSDQLTTRAVTGLKSGQSYSWKVIAEDGKGGMTESETRRFTAK
jgi:hypothetical protein